MNVFTALKLILHYPFTFYPVFRTLLPFIPHMYANITLFCTCQVFSIHYHKNLHLSSLLSHPHNALTPLHITAISAYLIKPYKIVHDCVLPVYPSQYSTLNLKRNYEQFWPQIWRFNTSLYSQYHLSVFPSLLQPSYPSKHFNSHKQKNIVYWQN